MATTDSGESAETVESDGTLHQHYLFQQLQEYPWEADREFQHGLSAILGSVQDPSQTAHLTRRAQCYYFARKADTPIDFDAYTAWVEEQRPNADDAALSSPSTGLPPAAAGGDTGGMGNAPKPASFADICDMIAEGKPIPGIKDIPDTILEGQASERRREERRKPWEKEAADRGEEGQQPAWMTRNER